MNKQDYIDLAYKNEVARKYTPYTIDDLTDLHYLDDSRHGIGFLEMRESGRIHACILTPMAVGIGIHTSERFIILSKNNYNKNWRVWKIPPTEKMKEFPWIKEKKNED